MGSGSGGSRPRTMQDLIPSPSTYHYGWMFNGTSSATKGRRGGGKATAVAVPPQASTGLLQAHPAYGSEVWSWASDSPWYG